MAHIHDLIDFTVDVFIVHEDKVLLRMHEKYHTLLAVGGHIELDEDPVTAAKRECMEEVGLPIHIHSTSHVPKTDESEFRFLEVPDGLNIHRIDDVHQHISVVYFATAEHTNIVPERPEDTWEWLTKEEVETHADLRGNIRHYALQALAVLGTK